MTLQSATHFTMSKSDEIRIGALAANAGVRVQTIRYYERVGLLRPSRRDPSGYRWYDRKAIETLRFVKGVQRLGFSLEEISALIASGLLSQTHECGAASELARAKVTEIETKIRQLKSLKRKIGSLLRLCPAAGGGGTGCSVVSGPRIKELRQKPVSSQFGGSNERRIQRQS